MDKEMSIMQDGERSMSDRLFSDPVENTVAIALKGAGIRYVHESQNKDQVLDFYLPDLRCYIECKAFSTDRTAQQVKDKQVIVVQGYKAASAFAAIINPNKDSGDATKT